MTNKRPLSFLDSSVGQLGFVVEHLDDTMRAYHQTFGIGSWHVYTYGPNILSCMTYKGVPTSYSSRIALGYMGNTRIELIQPLQGHTVYTDFIEKHGYGLQHLGIYVQNIENALKQARNHEISIVMEGGGFGLDGDGYYAYLDTEETYGICYELIQPPLRRRTPESVYPLCDGTFFNYEKG